MIWQTPGFTSGITDPRSCEQTKILPWWRTWDGSKAMGNILWDPFPAGSMFWLQCHICAATQTELTVTSYLNYMPQIKQICSTLYRSCKKQSAGSEIRTHADLNSWSPPRWKGPSTLTRQKSSGAAIVAEPLPSNVWADMTECNIINHSQFSSMMRGMICVNNWCTRKSECNEKGSESKGLKSGG